MCGAQWAMTGRIFGAVAIEGDRRGQPDQANLVLSEEAIDGESDVAVGSAARVLADHRTAKDRPRVAVRPESSTRRSAPSSTAAR